MGQPLVHILLGSDSDYEVMAETARVLRTFDVAFELSVASAHRTPARAQELASTAASRGLKVLVCAAGGAAHLAGAVAAHTTLPVIGVPLDATSLRGLDALLATVQMPSGVPVATVAVGKWGAHNAALLAVQILALSDERLAAALLDHKARQVQGVADKDARLQARLAEESPT